MKRIASFEVDHNTLTEGVYLSRKDGDVTTWDIRFVKPNTPPFLEMPAVHTIEHLFATYVRNSSFSDRIIYFGPMGCQTGFYLIVRNSDNSETLSVVKKVLERIIDHNGDMFGAIKKECGNYKNLDLDTAKKECRRYLDILNSKENDFLYKTGG